MFFHVFLLTLDAATGKSHFQDWQQFLQAPQLSKAILRIQSWRLGVGRNKSTMREFPRNVHQPKKWVKHEDAIIGETLFRQCGSWAHSWFVLRQNNLIPNNHDLGIILKNHRFKTLPLCLTNLIPSSIHIWVNFKKFLGNKSKCHAGVKNWNLQFFS